MITIDVVHTKDAKMRKFIKNFPNHADTIANAVADAFAVRAQRSAQGKNLPREAAPSIGAWKSSRGTKPYIVRPGKGISGRLNFLAVFERPGSGWPNRPFMGPALTGFNSKKIAESVYNRILRGAL